MCRSGDLTPLNTTRDSIMTPNHSSSTRFASIDIGTNTILLLIAEVKAGQLIPLVERETIVRLGQGLHPSGVLSREAMERALHTLTHYLEHCRAMKVQRVFAIGTSALREARNTQDFFGEIEK